MGCLLTEKLNDVSLLHVSVHTECLGILDRLFRSTTLARVRDIYTDSRTQKYKASSVVLFVSCLLSFLSFFLLIVVLSVVGV